RDPKIIHTSVNQRHPRANPRTMTTTVVHERYRTVYPDSFDSRAGQRVSRDENATHGHHKEVLDSVHVEKDNRVRRASTTAFLDPVVKKMKCGQLGMHCICLAASWDETPSQY
ncbi:MAG: hypothetical protein ACKPKO_22565, partial [Candidatus Fonsibacter sp.]